MIKALSALSMKKIKRIGMLCTVIIMLLVMTVPMLACDTTGGSPVSVVDNDTLEYKGFEYVKKKGVETVLMLGLDKFEGEVKDNSYNNDQQADFLMLFVIDNESKSINALHINRDTMAYINVLGLAGEKVDTVYEQIALAHTYGKGGKVSCSNTSDAVSKLLNDTKIDHYISVTMDAVAEFNDLVGGVEVTVLEDFTGIDDTLVKGETVTLMGEHALNYVRTRYGLEDSTNSTRMERQRQYIEALVEKTHTVAEQDPDFAIDALELTSDYLVSDCSATRLESLFDKMMTYEVAEIYSFEGESKKGDRYMEFYPDEDSINEVLVNLFYNPA